ncbi:hypothetical protein C9J44_21320 [Photobacterium sp. GB-27]|nr:hypothetical protein C9J44_21320 [Photobacterium sp. GB-27]
MRLLIFVFLSYSFRIFSILNSSSNGLDIINYIYQFKVDSFLIIYVFSIYLYFSNKEKINNVDKVLSLFVIFGLINALFAICQRIFMFDFLHFIGLSDISSDNIPSLGIINGLVLQTQNGLFRSIGLMSTPMACAEFSLLSLFIYLYRYYNRSVKGTLIIFIYIVAIYFTGYKTVYLSTFAILISYLIPRYRTIITYSISFVYIIFGFLSVNTLFVYDFFKKISPLYAEYSIKLRYDYLMDVIKSLHDNIFITNFAFNGNYYELIPKAVPLDSMYIYYISNYGIIGGVVLFIAFCYIFILSKNLNIIIDGRKIPIGLYLILFLSINLFFNQPFINFPSGIHVVLLMVIAIIQKKNIKNCCNK